MDANLITALAGVLGSASGASAAIVTTWISQKSQTTRERAKWKTRKRETLYGDFITEASHLIADALDHSLNKPETLVKLYANLGRIRLVSSDAVLVAAEEERRQLSTKQLAQRHHESVLKLWFADFPTAEWPAGSVMTFTCFWKRDQR
jgi:hypothetical protein